MRVVAGSIAVATIFAVSADASVRYSVPQQLASAGGGPPQVVTDAHGRAVVAWCDAFRFGCYSGPRAVRIDADGSHGEVRELSAFGVGASDWDLAGSADGDALVVYQAKNPPRVIMAGSLAGDGTVSTQIISNDSPYGSFAPQVAFDSAGVARAVWSVHRSNNDDLIKTTTISSNGPAGPVARISEGGERAGFPQIDFDADDIAHVVWRGHGKAVATRVNAAGEVASSSTMKLRHEDSLLGIASGRAPHPFAILFRRGRRGLRGRLVAVRLSDPRSPVRLRVGPVNQLDLDVDERGRVFVVWSESRFGVRTVRMVRISRSGDSTRLLELPRTAHADAHMPTVATDSSGRATVAWRYDAIDGESQIRAVTIGPKGRLGSVQTIATEPGASRPAVAIDSRQRPIVAWTSGGTVQLARGER